MSITETDPVIELVIELVTARVTAYALHVRSRRDALHAARKSRKG
ncbi:MAG: hypothetical protein ABJ239_11110 [Erythrobacter sp.]